MKAFGLFLVVLLALVLGTRSAAAEPLRVLVAVSAKKGSDHEQTLHHADKDVARVRDLFVRLGGVRPENAIVLSEPSRAELMAAFARARTQVQAKPAKDVTLIFYFSGHGDRSKIHLGNDAVSKVDIATAMGQVPAALRIAVTDACRTGDGQQKGPSLEPGFAIEVPDVPSASGAVWIHASADGEPAQESDELQGAVFTHYWLSGLRGAADNDGDRRVTLHESYNYAFNQTLFRSTQSSGVAQRPAVDEQLKESAPIVLTELDSRTASLRLPQGSDAHYYVYSALGKVIMAEGWSNPDHRVMLALPPGRYVVQRRRPLPAALELVLGRAETRDVEPSDFHAVPEEILVSKGGDLVLRPHELSLGYAVVHDESNDFGQRLALAYAYRMSDVGLRFGVEAGLGTAQNDANDIRTLSGGARAGMFVIGRFSTRLSWLLGADARLAVASERITRRDAASVQSAGYATVRTSSAWIPGAEVRGGLRLDVGSAVWLEGTPFGTLMVPKRGSSLAPELGVGGELRLGASF